MSEDLKMNVQSHRSIPEGQHPGRIVKLSTRETNFGPYLDVAIDVLDMSGESPEVISTLTAGYPAKITSQTYLGQLLERFGVNLEEGSAIDLAEILQETPVIFSTEDERTEDGTFAQIEKQTVRPHPEFSHEDVWGMDED